MWESLVMGWGDGMVRAENCRRNIQKEAMRPEPVTWGKPGSAEWAEEVGSREESEEESF